MSSAAVTRSKSSIFDLIKEKDSSSASPTPESTVSPAPKFTTTLYSYPKSKEIEGKVIIPLLEKVETLTSVFFACGTIAVNAGGKLIDQPGIIGRWFSTDNKPLLIEAHLPKGNAFVIFDIHYQGSTIVDKIEYQFSNISDKRVPPLPSLPPSSMPLFQPSTNGRSFNFHRGVTTPPTEGLDYGKVFDDQNATNVKKVHDAYRVAELIFQRAHAVVNLMESGNISVKKDASSLQELTKNILWTVEDLFHKMEKTPLVTNIGSHMGKIEYLLFATEELSSLTEEFQKKASPLKNSKLDSLIQQLLIWIPMNSENFTKLLSWEYKPDPKQEEKKG